MLSRINSSNVDSDRAINHTSLDRNIHIMAHPVEEESHVSDAGLATPGSSGRATPQQDPSPGQQARALDRSRGRSYHQEVTTAVDPIALITTECISVTAAMRKHARWAHSSVSAILGGGVSAGRSGESTQRSTLDGSGPRRQNWSKDFVNSRSYSPGDTGAVNRWGLRGKKGKSVQDNPLISAFAQLRSDLSRCTGTV